MDFDFVMRSSFDCKSNQLTNQSIPHQVETDCCLEIIISKQKLIYYAMCMEKEEEMEGSGYGG